jgi:DNA-binding transcriptional LysR family regulator
VDVRSLRFALTLADELHFGRAASAHYIAAQAFGRRIQELERELGTKLFERTSRRVALTPAGERFLPHGVGKVAVSRC